MYVQKIIKCHERLPQKTPRGDNWPAAITGRLPVHLNEYYEMCSETIISMLEGILEYWVKTVVFNSS